MVASYAVGDVVELDARSCSPDEGVACSFSFGVHGDADSQLLVLDGACGVALVDSEFPEQGEWLVSGRFVVAAVSSDAARELDEVVHLRATT